MGMQRGKRMLVVEFEATSPGAKAFAEKVYALCEEHLSDDDWHITSDFSPPTGWFQHKPAPVIRVEK
jgi:hypothetical protein